MNEQRIQDDRDFRAEDRLMAHAERLAREHQLGARVFSCEDERREAIAEIMVGVLGDEQRAVVADRLREMAGPVID